MSNEKIDIRNEISYVIDRLVYLVRKFVDNVEKHRFELKYITWIDDYNGRSPLTLYVYGIELQDTELRRAVSKALSILYGDLVEVDYIVATDDDVIVQYHYEVYNEYGRYVGTTHGYISLYTLINRISNIRIPNPSEVIAKIKESISKISQ